MHERAVAAKTGAETPAMPLRNAGHGYEFRRLRYGRRMKSSDDHVPVLLAGGGLVGLSTAMFLAQHGIPSLAIERLAGGSQLPRAAFFHMRTIELFSAAGIEDEVRAQSSREFTPEGA